MTSDRVLVVVPTYNEAENIQRITQRLHTAVPHADLLIADDNSPDGTGKIADEMSDADKRVHVMHRPGKQGLGAAYIAGFRWALEHGYDVIVEMDADGSHAPEQLPDLLAKISEVDLVLGSRWVRGGSVENWPKHREILSRSGSVYARLLLGVSVRDATGGYRAYRRRVLETLDLDAIVSQGYCFQIDLVWRTQKAGFHVAEVPIHFADREFGASKMSSSIVREAFLRVTQWGVRDKCARLFGRRRKEKLPNKTG